MKFTILLTIAGMFLAQTRAGETAAERRSFEYESMMGEAFVEPSCDDCQPQTVLHVQDKKTGAVREKKFSLGIFEIVELERVAGLDRLVLIGRANSTVYRVSLFDLDALREIHAFYCNFPSLSTKRASLAFVGFVPTRVFEPLAASAVYCVFDLTQSISPSSTEDWVKSPAYWAGTPFYPLANLESGGYRPEDTEGRTWEDIHSLADEGFHWSGDGMETVRFVDRFRNEFTLVEAELAWPTLRVAATPLDLDSLFSELSAQAREALKRGPVFEDVEASAQGRVRLVVSSGDLASPIAVEFKLDPAKTRVVERTVGRR